MLYQKINGRRDQVLYITIKQKLTPEEEEFLQSWVLQLQYWGFLSRIAQLCKMVEELLQAKQDFKELGKNWSEKFINRHPVPQSKYNRTFDQEQFLAQNWDSIREWFDLYLFIKAQHDILDKNTYNMDENDYMMGIAGSTKVVVLKYSKRAFINQAGSRE